jgi:three-Cys-motif partner protein
MPKVNSKKFFQEQTAHSRVKAEIVQKFVIAWLDIVTGFQRNNDIFAEAAYVDLFAGPGTYEDGSRSTPLLVMEQVLKRAKRAASLRAYFNDNEVGYTASLRQEINGLSNINGLKHAPVFTSEPATISLIESFGLTRDVPQFYFLDQFGYSDVMPSLIRHIFHAQMCDCAFFFRTSRAIAAVDNPKTQETLAELFGRTRLDELKSRFKGTRIDREEAILAVLKAAMADAGVIHFLAFPFRIHDDGSSKHHLIYLAKHAKGYELMKDILSKNSSLFHNGVPVLGFTEVPTSGLLFPDDPLLELERAISSKYAGQTMTVGQLFQADHISNERFILKNYQEALRRLEEKGAVSANPPATSRRPYDGKVTMGMNVEITFTGGIAT